MYDFSWKDPLSWIAVGVPLIVFALFVVLIWEAIKWLIS